MDTMTFTTQSTGAVPPEKLVCANSPALREIYERAASLGLTNVMEACRRICEAKEERPKYARAP